MRKRQPEKPAFGLDDYNQPTEPIEPIILPPVYSPGGQQQNPWTGAPHYNQQPAYPYQPDATANYPFQQPVNYAMPPQPYPYYAGNAAYPVLPPAPRSDAGDLPPGGSAQGVRSRKKSRKRWLIPGLVKLFFALVQGTLLLHAIFMLFSIPVTNIWLNLLFQISDLFLIPVRELAANINLSILAGTALLTYLEFLVAIFAYWLFSRLLVALLRALLR